MMQDLANLENTYLCQTVFTEKVFASNQEDIRQDRRGFGGHYLRKHPIRASHELVGELLIYHM